MSASEGSKDKLAFVNDAGNAIMKVDNTSTVALGSNRNTVRIATHDRFGIGSLWIVDMLHVPFGVRHAPLASPCIIRCSSWLAVCDVAGVLVASTRLARRG